jgi:Ca-activated chloride channel family protein
VTFAYPWALVAFVPAVFLYLRYVGTLRSESLGWSSLSVAESLPRSWKQRFLWLPGAVHILALATLTVALARPQMQIVTSTMERDGVAIELLVDISSSMEMTVRYQSRNVSRMFVAKEVLREFIQGKEGELSGRPNDLLGLITFARYADTICPLTLSHEAIVFLAEQLVINDRPNEDGTAYGDATALAAARLARLEETLPGAEESSVPPVIIKSKLIILLTDGENNCGRMLPLQAAALAKKWGIRIYTISLTDPPQNQFVRVEGDESIEVARARSAAEQVLEQMAQSTGGIFRRAHDFDTLKAVYQEIDRLERTELRSAFRRVPEEKFAWFAIATLVLLAIEFILRSTWLRRIP